jgi:formylglycine-generating enzyme required for sulfatase activity
MPYRAFVSSTYIDLKDHRAHVIRELRRSGFSVDPMEDWAADTDEPKNFAPKRVKGCDLCILIVAFKRGHVPEGEAKSITQLEYEAAKKEDIDILVYILDEDAAWPRKFDELDKDPEIRKWREQLIEHKGIETFTLDPATINIAPALTRWIANKRHDSGTDGADLMDISAYLAWIKERCGQMDLRRLANQPVTVDLPELYIPLYADDPEQIRERYRLPELFKSTKSPDITEFCEYKTNPLRFPVDIEELVAKNDYLLIEGDPGSGKTTLLKRIALSMSENYGEKELPLPVLVFLRELAEVLTGVDYKTMNAEMLLERYFAHHEKMLTSKAIKRFCEEKKALFLIDGLDEVPPEIRNRIVEAFADLRTRYSARMVLSGRPHGIDGVAMERFGKNYIRVLPFNPRQQEQFITRWCEVMYVKTPGEGAKIAVEMKAEIKGHDAIGALVENPLMLTTVCILKYEGERLPDQRAELYRKFIENLVHRRFSDPEKILDVLQNLGFNMQKDGEKGIDRCDALKVVRNVFSQERGEAEKAYCRRIEAKFDELEPKCGLLRLEGGQYRFWHLTFQEYLAAEYLISSSADLVKAIEPFLLNDRNNEMIKLYIGCLSINQKKVAATIIRNMIKDQSAQESHLILAGESLADIKKERRDEEIDTMARERFNTAMTKTENKKTKANFGEIIGWLGDERKLKEFITIKGGYYELKGMGKKELKTFEIGKYPVTNAWYKEFVEANGYGNDKYWTVEGRKWKSYTNTITPVYWGQKNWSCPNKPVIGICWWEAQAFINWLNVIKWEGYTTYRLPAEDEWQAAAAGFEGRRYAWGDEFDVEKCNCGGSEGQAGGTTSVGIFEAGNTPEGIADMSGNVLEWCLITLGKKKVVKDIPWDQEIQKLLDKKSYDEAAKLQNKKGLALPFLRGGAWSFNEYDVRCNMRTCQAPNIQHFYIGFRCIR